MISMASLRFNTFYSFLFVFASLSFNFSKANAQDSLSVTFSVNTQNITVGPNGMYIGGGTFGHAMALPLSDNDGDGIWTGVTYVVNGISGHYTILNSPMNNFDWEARENITGLHCADPESFNDRIFPAISSDTTLLHCFETCDTDGTCPLILGCTDILACNYDSLVTIDNGSCSYAEAGYDCDSLCLVDTDEDGICDYFEIVGCTEISAYNYNPLAEILDTCIFYTDTLCLFSDAQIYSNDELGELFIYADLNNYNAQLVNNTLIELNLYNPSFDTVISIDINESISPDGDAHYLNNLCGLYQYDIVWINSPSLCEDTLLSGDLDFLNDYNNDGICDYLQSYGCIDSSATNYNPLALIDDGSCITPELGCTDTSSFFFNPTADTMSAYGGPLNHLVYGDGGFHTNDAYDMLFDCLNNVTINSIDVLSQASFEVEIEILDYNNIQIYNNTFDLIEGWNTLNLDFDLSVGSDYKIGVIGENQGLYRNNNVGSEVFPINILEYINITGNTTPVPQGLFYYFYNWQLSVNCEIPGCTDSDAYNYDPNAYISNGNCIYLGCTDILADNYNSLANTDDGSCYFTSLSPNISETNIGYYSFILYGLPYNTDVRFSSDSIIVLVDNVQFNENESTLEIYTNFNIGFWDVEYYDYETNNWTVLIINGLEIQPSPPGPSISNITPGQISTYSGYTEFEITFSNIGFTFQNGITYWYDFRVQDYNGEHLDFDPISIVNDSTILVVSDVNIDYPSIFQEWYIDIALDGIPIMLFGDLNSHIEVVMSNPCENEIDFYINNVFSNSINYDTLKVCENSIVSVETYPYSSSNFYWDNNSLTDNLLIDSEQSRVLFYSDDDTTCEINSYEFEFIELDDVAITTVIPNSCYGINDGYIEIISPTQTIDMGPTCCDEMGNDYIEVDTIPGYSYYTDQMSFYEYLENQGGFSSLTVFNSSDMSNLYVRNDFRALGCIVDIDFNIDPSSPQVYTLPFEENFDSGMPCDWNNNSHWSFGSISEVEGPYWNIPNHNQFAVSNDDACDCDMMQDRLISPPLILDNLEDDISLSFSAFFTADYGSIASIEISNDMGYSWQNLVVLTPSSNWQDISINISNYATSDTIQLAFSHSDSHSWGSGFAIDDVLVDIQCLDSDDDGFCDIDEVFGCTNILADNFDELATEDDGSCYIEIIGCTDPSAGNYNPDATIDDGSCHSPLLPCDIVPTALFVDDIIHNRVVFNWSAPSAAPSHYMIRYRAVGTSSWTVMTAGPVNSNEFTGTSRARYFMEPGTSYEWSMRARVLNEDGSTNCQSSWSASNEYTTLDACANLENLSVSTEAVWATLSADAPAAEWGVWQSKGKMRVVGTNSFRYVNGDEYGNISNLKGNFTPSTDYEWHTKSWCTGNVDSEGNSDPMYHSGWGDFSSFTTEAPCDKMPTNLSTSANGAQTAITMSWDTPDSGAPDHYFLELTNVTTGQVWAWNNISGSDNSKTKFGLTAGDYSWRIRGACGTNGTSWATIFSQPVTYTLGGARLENSSVANLDVYPNPSRDIFNVTFTSEEAQTMTVKVVNMIGEEIFTEELTEFVGQYTQVIDMNTQPKGVYFLEITTSTGGINKKIVLQ